MTRNSPPKALVLLSGGLDSALAAHLLRSLGVEVTGLNFSTGFCIYQHQHRTSLDQTSEPRLFNAAEKCADRLGIPFMSVDISREFLDVVLNPAHGYGANANPCIDCRILMLRKAGELMKETGADIVATGEVIGQRPMSQRRDTMDVVERDSGLRGRLLRPLCAKSMRPTEAESSGLIDRERLLDFSGRGRKPQISLARESGLLDFNAASSGCCFLADPRYGDKFKDKVKHAGKRLSLEDFELLMVGRHFRLSPSLKFVVGRKFEENLVLERFARGRLRLEAPDVKGPVALFDEGTPDEGQELLGCRILARYTDAKHEEKVRVEVSLDGRLMRSVQAEPLRDDADLRDLRV